MSRLNLNDLVIANMTRQEVDVAVEWARLEGWNPGLNDAECFYQADPTGFYAAKLNGEIVGIISIVKYADDFVFEGLYIVKPEYRGMGIGGKIQQFAIEASGDKNLGLDGVVSMQQKYKNYGLKTAYFSIRYASTAQKSPANACQPICAEDFKDVAAYDHACFGFERQNFLKCWLSQKTVTTRLIRGKKGDLSGFGVLRRCGVGYKIGPLFAQTADAAELLFDSLTATVAGETVYLDVPDPNTTAVAFAKKRRMQPVFSTVRMYSKKAPDVPLGKVFGVTTFELG